MHHSCLTRRSQRVRHTSTFPHQSYQALVASVPCLKFFSRHRYAHVTRNPYSVTSLRRYGLVNNCLKKFCSECGAESAPAGQRLPAAGRDLAWAARTGSGPMWMCGDIFAAARRWRGRLLTTGRLSCLHPVVVCAGRGRGVAVAGRAVAWAGRRSTLGPRWVNRGSPIFGGQPWVPVEN